MAPTPTWRNVLLAALTVAARARCAAEPPEAPARESSVIAYGGHVTPPMVGADYAKAQAPAVGEPKKKWERALPFFAQRVVDRGIDLPNPYNVAVSGYFGREDRELSDLAVGFNGAPLQELDFVKFPNAKVQYQAYQFQVGAWILPFLNVYSILGYTQGGGDIDITIGGAGLMNFLGIPGCAPLPVLPICTQTFRGTAKADYTGKTAGIGMTVAGAHDNLFFAAPMSYVISDITQSTTPGRTLNISPRLGWNQHTEHGLVTWYGGATYLYSKVSITGSFVIPTAGTPIGANTTMDFEIRVQQKDNWNYLAGANWSINKTWGVMGEVGFGNTRQNLLFNVFYRF